MEANLTILNLIKDASPVVQIVMVILIIASLLSWTLILVKGGRLRTIKRGVESFEDRFWSGISLNSLYEELKTKKEKKALEHIFFDGYNEYTRLSKTNSKVTIPIIDSAQRAMRVATSREIDELERNLAFLATVGSTSPYIGLFGTVWGIMDAFLSLGQASQATLAVVAPGIAEALIATAIGLFAAIPAVVAYNRFSDHVDRLSLNYDNFREELTGLLERQMLIKGRG